MQAISKTIIKAVKNKEVLVNMRWNLSNLFIIRSVALNPLIPD